MLEAIEYKKIFTYFEIISEIPRGSYHNEKIGEYLVSFAQTHHLEYRKDAAGNVIIKKPASDGAKSREPIILQGHMDMVCVSEDGTHDFQNDGLSLRINGDFIEADGTTLGGDDGIALAYILAVLDSDDIVHPPIEAIFTTDEEVGMEGAMALDVSDLKAKKMINLDNEEEGVLLVSCAGGATAQISFQEQMETVRGKKIDVELSGLAGGHSGTEIARHPANAAILLGRLLGMAEKNGTFRILSFDGGEKDNVIMDSARASILCESDEKELFNGLNQYAALLTGEFLSGEPNLRICISEPEDFEGECFSADFTQGILKFLNLVITGVQVMSADVKGMVESSLNLGVAKTEPSRESFVFSVRSQKETYREYMLYQLEQLARSVMSEQIKVAFETRGKYPAWEYKKDSQLRTVMAEEYQKLFGKMPRIEGIHAGLECGILSEKRKGLDIISLGPDIFDIHTVKERLSISSAKRNFDYLLRVLERLA